MERAKGRCAIATLLTLVTKFVADTDQYDRAVKNSTGNTAGLADAAGKAASMIAGALVTGVVALSAAIAGAIALTENWVGLLDDAGDQFGMTGREAAGLNLILRQSGQSAQEFYGEMDVMMRTLTTADGKLGKSGLAFLSLGISIYDSNGHLKTASQLLQEAANKLDTLPDGIRKSQLEMELFGKSGVKMNDTLNLLSNDGFENAQARADRLGLSLNPQSQQSFITFNRTIERLKDVFLALAVALASEVLPYLQPLLNWVLKMAEDSLPIIVKAMKDFMEELSKWKFIQDIANWFANLNISGAGFVGWLTDLSGKLTDANGNITLFGGLILTVALIVGLILAAALVGAMISVLVFVVRLGLANDGIGLLVASVAFMLWGFIQTLIWFGEAIGVGNPFENFFNITLPAMVFMAGLAWEQIKRGFQLFVDFFTGKWDKLGADLKAIWDATWFVIINLIGGLLDLIDPELSVTVQGILAWFRDVNWFQVGYDIIQGILNGIKNAAGLLYTEIQTLGQNLPDWLKKILDIHSPSLVFAGIGQNMMLGMAQGIQSTGASVQSAIGDVTLGALNPPVPQVKTTAGSDAGVLGHRMTNREGVASNDQFDYKRMGYEMVNALKKVGVVA